MPYSKLISERLKHLFDNLDEDQDKGILKQKIDITESTKLGINCQSGKLKPA